MKLLRPNTRVSTEDSLGHGMDAVIVLVLFTGAGFLLDRWLGTMPILTIVLTVLGAVGLFAKFKYRYDERMLELEAERAGLRAQRAADRAAAGQVTPVDTTTDDGKVA